MCQVLDTFREWKANTRACVQRTLGCPAKGGFESTEGHAAAHSLPAAARCSSWETLDLTRFQTSLAEKWKTYADLHIWFVLLANLIMPRNQCTVAVKSAIFLTCPHRWTFWLIYIYIRLYFYDDIYIYVCVRWCLPLRYIYICVCPLMFTFKRYIYIYIRTCSESRSVKGSLSRGLCVSVRRLRLKLPQPSVQWSAWPRFAAMACGLCGRQGHSVLTCKLPGAEAFRKMRRQLKVKKKQAGRKPKRLSIPSKKDWKKKQRKAYPGNSDGKKKQAALEKKTKGGICDVCPLEAIKRLQNLGYLKTVRPLSHVWRGSPERTVRVEKSDKASLSPMQSRRMPLQDELSHTV